MDANLRAAIVTIGTALGTVLAAIAMHGKAALEAAAGVPALLQAWAAGLPLGIWSFVLATVLSVLVWAVAMRKLQKPDTARAPHVSADTVALAIALLVCLAEQWTQGVSSRGAILNAIFMGLIAGLLAPYLGRALRVLLRKKEATP